MRLRDTFPCGRCGAPLTKINSVCRDCRAADPVYITMLNRKKKERDHATVR